MPSLMALGLVFTTIAVLSDGAWVVLAGAGGAWLSSSPRRLARIRASGGAMMIGLGGALAFTGR